MFIINTYVRSAWLFMAAALGSPALVYAQSQPAGFPVETATSKMEKADTPQNPPSSTAEDVDLAKGLSEDIEKNNLAAEHYRDGRYNEALDLAKVVADRNPSVWKFQLNTGIILLQQGRVQESLTYVKRAHQAAPGEFMVTQQLCYVFARASMPVEAVTCYETIVDDPHADDVDRLNYGEALTVCGDLSHAEAVIRAVVERSPRLGRGFNDLGVIHYRRREFGNAVDSLRQAVSLEPDASQFRFNLGIAELAVKNRAGAISQYNLLKTADPSLANELYKTMFAGQTLNAGH